MNKFTDIDPDINVREEEYIRLLGYPAGYELVGKPRELADWAREWYNKNGKPWINAVKASSIDVSSSRLKINEFEFFSGHFRKQLANANADIAMLVAVSAGKELEEKARELWNEGKPDEYFFLEIYGSALVEHLIANTGAHLCAWSEQNNRTVLPHYSPGYPGWKVEDQIGLLKLIKSYSDNTFQFQLDVLQSGMLNPKKSMLAVFGITSDISVARSLPGLIPCENCSMISCSYRRAPYKRFPVQIENIEKLQPDYNRRAEDDRMPSSGKTVLNPDADYSINRKALAKWSEERLTISKLNDGTLSAKFNYEGSTCSNLGHVIKFHYIITLSAAKENYKLLSLECIPVNGDDGYKFMCEYIDSGEEFMKTIDNEKPFLGRPVEDVLSWQREFSPEGCYCKSASRIHKWGQVLEVIHYTLVRYEKGEIEIPEMIFERNEVNKLQE